MANVKNFAVTPVKKEVHTDNLDLIRNKILDLCEDYMVERGDQYIIPGEDFIPASSKVLDSSDLKALVESSLDLWLTSGRFSEKFEKELAKKFGSKKSILTVSGSAANLLAFSSLTSPMLKERRIRPGDGYLAAGTGQLQWRGYVGTARPRWLGDPSGGADGDIIGGGGTAGRAGGVFQARLFKRPHGFDAGRGDRRSG